MGLKESKKYAIGSIHENGGGKFETLARWYDETTDTIMLKIKYLDSGKIEENKEVNVNASEWKWRKVRGLAGNKTEKELLGEEEYADHKLHWEEVIEGLYVRMEKAVIENRELLGGCKHDFQGQLDIIKEMHSMIQILQKQMDGMQNQLEALNGDKTIINKLLEKI